MDSTQIQEKRLKLVKALVYPGIHNRLVGIGRNIVKACLITKFPVEEIEPVIEEFANDAARHVRREFNTSKEFQKEIAEAIATRKKQSSK